MAGDNPLALMHNWLPPAYSDLTREELEVNGLYAALRERGVKPVVAQQTIGARMPTTAERRALAIKGSQPVLTMSRMAFDAVGTRGRVRRPLLPGIGLLDHADGRRALTRGSLTDCVPFPG